MEKKVVADGLKTRYLEEGSGPVVLLLHGASLGSSADVYEKNIPELAKAGLRAVAFDSPGYGLTDNPKEFSDGYRTGFILKFMDALGIEKASLVSHSATGRMAARISLDHPRRVEKVIPLGATPLLPPLPDQRERPEAETNPPTLESTRKRLESDLFNKSLITEEMTQKRYRMSTGKNFETAVERAKAASESRAGKEETPLWKQFAKAAVPKLYLYGKQDRGGTVAKRCALMAEMEPGLKIHLLENCGHLVMIDAAEEFNKRVAEFLLR